MIASKHPYLQHSRYMSALILSVLLSACSSYSTKQDIDISTETYLAMPDTWSIYAKLGIKNDEDSGSVTLNWEQTRNDYHIQVSGPFGQGNAKLTGNDQLIRIEQPGKQTLYSKAPKMLVQQTFGWDLPLQHLPYWIRGLQNPNDSADTVQNKQYDDMGLLSGFSQYGWTITYSRYTPKQQRLAPHKIRAENGNITLTLIIKEWSFPTLATQE